MGCSGPMRRKTNRQAMKSDHSKEVSKLVCFRRGTCHNYDGRAGAAQILNGGKHHAIFFFNKAVLCPADIFVSSCFLSSTLTRSSLGILFRNKSEVQPCYPETTSLHLSFSWLQYCLHRPTGSRCFFYLHWQRRVYGSWQFLTCV